MLLGTLVPVVENLVLMALPHGGQRQARRNAWLAMVEGSTVRGPARPSRLPVKPPPSRRGVAKVPFLPPPDQDLAHPIRYLHAPGSNSKTTVYETSP